MLGRARAGLALAAGLILVGAVVVGSSTIAEAAGVLTVSPNTGLTDGENVSVTGSGLVANSPGSVLECNSDPAQPTISVAGNNVPVSCTNPFGALTGVSASGTISTSFSVHTGTVGPPAAGTDSSSGSSATDAAKYPCPPTSAQVTAGDKCVIVFGDLGGDQVSSPITFSSSPPPPPPPPPPSSGGSSSCTPQPNAVTVGSESLTVSQGTCLNGNDKVTVSGSGFTPNSPGSVIECSDAGNQPTVSVAGNNVPVSCTDPLKTLVTTSASGDVSYTFTIITGFAGPPGTGQDSAGTDAAADAASYPCPPTPAQVAAGASCVIAFGDLAGNQVSVPISFVANVVPTQTSPATPSDNNGSPPAGSNPPDSSGGLPFTGANTKLLWMAGLGGVLVYLGLMVVILATTPPRRRRRALRNPA